MIPARPDWHCVNGNHIVVYVFYCRPVLQFGSHTGCGCVHAHHQHRRRQFRRHYRVETNHSMFVDHRFVLLIVIWRYCVAHYNATWYIIKIVDLRCCMVAYKFEF